MGDHTWYGRVCWTLVRYDVIYQLRCLQQTFCTGFTFAHIISECRQAHTSLFTDGMLWIECLKGEAVSVCHFPLYGVRIYRYNDHLEAEDKRWQEADEFADEEDSAQPHLVRIEAPKGPPAKVKHASRLHDSFCKNIPYKDSDSDKSTSLDI